MPETDAQKRQRETEQLAEIEAKRGDALQRINSVQPANISETVKEAKRSLQSLHRNLKRAKPLVENRNKRNLLDNLRRIREKTLDCVLTNNDYIHASDLEELPKLLDELSSLSQITTNDEVRSAILETKESVRQYTTHFRKAE